MTTETQAKPSVIPAQLSFLAIYCPALGKSDESIEDQIIFYSSRAIRERRKHQGHGGQAVNDETQEKNERLRQVGLAQGMVDFAKNFSDGEPVDAIETEKSRIVLHELEPEWWILASIDLTRLPSTRHNNVTRDKVHVDYSSREVAPSKLILQHLLRAHAIFLLHHGSTLSELYQRSRREKFCTILDRFWTRFIWNWDVLLHGNPAVDIYNGTKLAAGGELGIGVGEEEWGSAEREVLEGFMSRTDGLLDLVVARFGDGPDQSASGTHLYDAALPQEPWLGVDRHLRASDGVVFSGVGTISKSALCSLSHWMEWIYKYGEKAYGVGENPSTIPRRKGQTAQRRATDVNDSGTLAESQQGSRSRDLWTSKALNHRGKSPDIRREAMLGNASSPLPPGIPPPLVAVVENSLEDATTKVRSEMAKDSQQDTLQQESKEASASGTERMMKYLTLGYGSAWSFSSMASSSSNTNSEAAQVDVPPQTVPDALEQKGEEEPLTQLDPSPEVGDQETQPFVQTIEPSVGRFIIGLLGDLEGESDSPSPKDSGTRKNTRDKSQPSNSRIMLRTLNLQISRTTSSVTQVYDDFPEDGANLVQPVSEFRKVQVAVYVHQPFIFLFVFALHTATLTYPSFYRSIDRQLGPLQRPLLVSTDPARALERIKSAISENENPDGSSHLSWIEHPVFELIYDPGKKTIRSSIPNIPPPGPLAVESLEQSKAPYASGSWFTLGIPTSQSSKLVPVPAARLMNRIQALSIHTHILNMYASTRRLFNEMERSIKTSRGYWITWMRVPPHISESEVPTSDIEARVESLGGHCKEVYLVRKSEGTESGPGVTTTRKLSGGNRWLIKDRDVSGSSAGSGGDNSRAPTEEMARGFDARKYVDALLRLNG